MHLRTTILGAAMAILPAAALAEAHETANPTVGGAEMSTDMNIVENAANSPIHTTLVAAVQAAGLVDTLASEGPFTVFAPTDDAFGALPEGLVDTLLMEENLEALQTVLTCHVVAGSVMAEAVIGLVEGGGGSAAVGTVGGCELTASVDGGNVMIQDERGGMATVTVADVVQSNGVIHVVDAVLLPAEDRLEITSMEASMDGDMSGDDMSGDTIADGEMSEDMSGDTMGGMTDTEMADTEMAGDGMSEDMSEDGMGEMAMDNPTVGGAAMSPSMTIVENALNSPIHTTLVAAVQAAGLVETLSSEGPFTVFAPTDDAFAALPAGTVETLLQEENRDQLVKILTAHVVPGRLTAADLTEGLTNAGRGFNNVTTVSGDALSVQTTDSGAVFVFDESGNAYRVSTADVMQSNGVIHVVDGVLLPH